MQIVLDAGPVIFFARLDAFDAFAVAGHMAVIPVAVEREVARPELAFRHPEIAVIERARRQDELAVVELDDHESRLAEEFRGRYGGLHAGELDVLTLGQSRSWPVCLHERQAARIAGAMGLVTIHLVEILFAGTRDPRVLASRIRAFARLTNMTMADLDSLLHLIRDQR